MPAANLTRVEAEERAALVHVDGYDVALDLTRGDTTFRSETLVRFRATVGASTFIEACTAEVHEIVLNGVALDPAKVSDGTRIALGGLAAENELRIVSDAAYTNSGEGLHRFVDPVDGRVYLYTEFAVAEANRVFAVFDQPDLKAAFRFTVTAPDDWQVLSNSATPSPSAGAAPGTAVWAFEPGPVISSYIAAIIAGPYEVWRSTAQTGDGRTVPLGLFTRASLAEHAEPGIMFETVQAGITFYENAYGVPFPYEKYDQIFVPEYNWGAMENVGAVTFNEGYLFRSKVAEARKEQRTIVVLHELSHMWFGNLVTMKWWNDLWLNESFATWTSTDATAEATPFRDAWSSFASTQKTRAALQDQLPSTHPIVASIADLEDVEVNFDGITYDKGASVLKQLVAWVGKDAFYRGVGAYLRAHAEGNATLGDLLRELEASSGRALAEWSRLWLETAGVNTLRPLIETDAAGRITRFAIEQSAAKSRPTLRPHRIAVGFYSPDGDRVVRTHRIELDIDGALTEVPELTGLPRPELVLLNDDDLTYAKIRLDAASLAFASANLARLDDPLARILVWGSVWDSVRDAESPASAFVRLVLGNVGHETQSTTRNTALTQLELALDRYVHPDHTHALRIEAGDSLWALAQLAGAGSDEQFQFTRAFIRLATTPAQLDIAAALLGGSQRVDGLEIDTDLRWEIVIALAAAGREVDVDAALAADDTAKGRQNAETARASRPDAAVKRTAWESVIGDTSLSNDLVRALTAGWRNAHPAALLEETTTDFFAALQTIWAERSFTMAAAIVTGLYPAPLVTEGVRDATRAWLAANDGPSALRRLVVEQLSELERALAARAADRPASGR